MNIEITSVTKSGQSLAESAAAVSVITNDDIRRSGATSIAEALRLAPGLDVAEIGLGTWAISARGFNGQYANKLLVLVDGRTVYSSMFAGVYWDTVDLMLEDVDRIEVIRGPGASVWGANAVNGVINIITKSAADTQGVLASAVVGSEDRGIGAVRWGGEPAPGLHVRTFGKYLDRDSSPTAGDDGRGDTWDSLRGGLRADWDATARDQVTVTADAYDAREAGPNTLPVLVPPFQETLDFQDRSLGGHVLSRWSHELSSSSSLQVQAFTGYYSEQIPSYVGERATTYDLEIQHNFALLDWNEVVWGLGYRIVADSTEPDRPLRWQPRARTTDVANGFVEDLIRLFDGRVLLTLGSKLEHNDYTGVEIQPTARALWRASPSQSLWASVSRAVRTPSRTDRGVDIVLAAFPTETGQVAAAELFGNSQVESETVVAYEAGYRAQPADWVSADVTGFYNRYDNLASLEQGEPFSDPAASPPHVVIPVVFTNGASGKSYGLELSGTVHPTQFWKVTAWYALQTLETDRNPGDFGQVSGQGTSPRHSGHVRSNLDLPYHLEFDTLLYLVDRLSADDVPGYARLDLRLGWRPAPSLELALGVRNLTRDRHGEFLSEGVTSGVTEIERSYFLGLAWRY